MAFDDVRLLAIEGLMSERQRRLDASSQKLDHAIEVMRTVPPDGVHRAVERMHLLFEEPKDLPSAPTLRGFRFLSGISLSHSWQHAVRCVLSVVFGFSVI